MNANTAAARYIADNKADAPIAITTWSNKALTRRQQREVYAWQIEAACEAMVAAGEAEKVESVMGATAYIAKQPEPREDRPS